MDFEEFMSMMIKSMRYSDTDEALKEAFKAFADFSDGGQEEEGLSAANLRHVMAALGEKITDEEAIQMVKMADTDGDGFVSYEGM